MSFLSLCIFLGYEFHVMAICAFYYIRQLKTKVKSISVVLTVKIILWNMSVFEKEKHHIFIVYHVLYDCMYMYFLRYQISPKSVLF